MRFIHELKDKAEELRHQWVEAREQRSRRRAERREEQRKLAKRRQALSALEDLEHHLKQRSVGAKELDGLSKRIPEMSGRQFEHFVAGIYRVRGYDVTLTEVSRDQGVDILADKGGERLAIQCKNLARKANNRPVQEVYAGSHFYGASRACVVSPTGYTAGAYELANRLGVELYDGRKVMAWISQINLSGDETPLPKDEAYMIDMEVYEVLGTQEGEYITLLMEAAKAREISRYDPQVTQRFEHTKSIIDEKLAEVIEKMDAIEDRYLEEMREAQLVRLGKRAAGYLMIGFLGLAAREGIEIISYRSASNSNEIVFAGSHAAEPTVIINPQITIPAGESTYRVLKIHELALREQTDGYPAGFVAEPRLTLRERTNR